MTLLQMGRYGDAMNVLPALLEGGEMILSSEYVNLLDGCSYAKGIVSDWNLESCRIARPDAKVTLVAGRVGRSLCLDSWAATGLSEEEWRDRPLVFDLRELEREKHWLGPLGCADKVLVNFGDFRSSFRFLEADKFFVELTLRMGTKSMDISHVRTPRIYDMLGILEVAAGLITVDSGLLHLSRACGVPTVAIGPSDPYLFTPSRPHWIGRYTEDSVMGCVDEIARLFK